MLIKTRIFCKLIDGLNISIISLIFFLSFISLNTQSNWTMFYSSMIEIRNKNNNINDYISKTEEYFLHEIMNEDEIKNANPDDLIYLLKTKEKERSNSLSLVLEEMTKGFNDGKYQHGY